MREAGPETPDMLYERVLGQTIIDLRNFADSADDAQRELLKKDLEALLSGLDAKNEKLAQAA